MIDELEQERIFERIRKEDYEQAYKEAYKETYEKAYEKAFNESFRGSMAKAIRYVMKNQNISFEEAMKVLGLPVSERADYANRVGAN